MLQRKVLKKGEEFRDGKLLIRSNNRHLGGAAQPRERRTLQERQAAKAWEKGGLKHARKNRLDSWQSLTTLVTRVQTGGGGGGEKRSSSMRTSRQKREERGCRKRLPSKRMLESIAPSTRLANEAGSLEGEGRKTWPAESTAAVG